MAGGSVAAARSTAGGEWLGWVAILALAASLRLYGIGSEPLWLGEAYSWWNARQTLDDLWRLVPQWIPRPPLYAAVLRTGCRRRRAPRPARSRADWCGDDGGLTRRPRGVGPGRMDRRPAAIAPFRRVRHETRPYAWCARLAWWCSAHCALRTCASRSTGGRADCIGRGPRNRAVVEQHFRPAARRARHDGARPARSIQRASRSSR
jgi:hypothetical protein